MLTYLLSLAFIVCIVSLIWSLATIRKQRNKELDKGLNPTTVKHQILANPILIAYVLFPIVVALGAVLVMYLNR
ncbi:ABC-type Fe3+ transport system permease subunit [Paenibacillus sp. PvR052]|nr:ABC-type Fe3+ transport system permease subunit [Paenibacillus sp. PvP091]MBP1172060.1 ABC-type Fe3+ transport system permease subunit [Paenibacillus sp. PvR098]MBP2438441.1 ABC-type Fe3+ transport system permease subunit [Paenibacillus sp. PvP052]